MIVENQINEQFANVFKNFESNPLGTRVLVEVNSPVIKEEVIQQFRDRVSLLGYFPVLLKLHNNTPIQTQIEETALTAPFGKIVFIVEDLLDFYNEFPNEKEAVEYLERSVPTFNIFRHAFTFWVSTFLYDSLYRGAPEFLKFCWDKVKFKVEGEIPLATEYELRGKQVQKVREQKIEILEAQLSEILRKNPEDLQRINVLQTLSNNYFEHKDYEKAFEAYQACVESGISNIYNVAYFKYRMGIIYQIWGRYDKAMEIYSEVKTIRENLNDKEGLAIIYLQIGILYQDLGNFDEAVNCYNRSRGFFNDLENQVCKAHVILNIGTIYYNYGNKKAAFDSIIEALTLYKKNADPFGVSLCMAHIGQLNFHNKKYEQAIKYFMISRMMYDQQRNDTMLGLIDRNLEIIRNLVGEQLFAEYRQAIRKSLEEKAKEEL